MLNIKRIVAIILLASPLTFWGQGKNAPRIYTKDQPISRTEYNFNGEKKTRNYFYLNASIGPNILQGDNKKYKIGFEGNLGLGYQLTEFLGFEGKLGYAAFNGDFKNIGIVEHKSNAIEANVNVMLDLTTLIWGYKSNRKFTVTPHIGFGQVQSRGRSVYSNGRIVSYGYKKNYDDPNYNTKLEDGKVKIGDGTYLKPYGGGIGGRIVSATIPVGILLSYNINNYTKVHLDIVPTKVLGDRLDAVPSGSSNDYYTTFNVRFQYNLKKHKKVYSPCDNNGFGDYKRARRW